MTRKEALAEAQRRWGKMGSAWADREKNYPQGYMRKVGVCDRTRSEHYDIFVKYGNGPTWEEAFADADRREGKSE